MKKELHESLEIIKKAGFLIEDKYMDDMDKELDQTVLFNKIVEALKAAGYTKCGIKGDSVYVWPVDATERYCVCIDKHDLFRDTFYCKVLDREKHKYAAKYYFTVQGDKVKRNGFGEPPAFYGPLGSIAAPGQEYIEGAIKPGFFKRLFHKESVQESVETLSKAGFLVEASDKAKSIRDQITRAAIEKFEEIPYDEFEQEPWEDSDAIDAIPDEKFFEVMKSAINVKTQEEVLQAAEDEDKFNILADAWLEYLSDLSGYVGWEYTWNRDY